MPNCHLPAHPIYRYLHLPLAPDPIHFQPRHAHYPLARHPIIPYYNNSPIQNQIQTFPALQILSDMAYITVIRIISTACELTPMFSETSSLNSTTAT